MNRPALDKLARCKTHVLLAYPWWATLLLQLHAVETTQVPTMAVDGTHLFYNPTFTLKLSDNECEGALLHETAHCALLHCYRRKWRDPLLWNIAADAAVNALLLADSITLPHGCVPPAALEKTAEQIYDEMSSQKQKNPSQPQDVYAPGELGEGENSGGSTATEPIEGMTESKWRDVMASSRGLEPASLSRTLSDNSRPTKNWREELARFISQTQKADFHTWTRPSRRLSGMPGWKREPEATIAVCIDTSGSIDESLLSAFAAECRSICAISGIKAYIISADAAVGDVIEPGDEFPISLKGGGGTSFIPALVKAESLGVSGALYFTDGDGSFPAEITLPVLWALTQHRTVPFGESIYLEKGE